MMLNFFLRQKQQSVRFFSTGISLEGISHSGGFFKGKASVIPSLKQAKKFIPGNVLVIKSADNRWNDLIADCGALVQEKGDATSHGVWSCWKQGIPVVSGIKDLFSYIEDDDEVVVRGSLGKVEVYRTEKPASSLTKKGKVADAKSGYILYSAAMRDAIVKQNPNLTPTEVMKKLGDSWKAAPKDEKDKYILQARAEKNSLTDEENANAKKASVKKSIRSKTKNLGALGTEEKTERSKSAYQFFMTENRQKFKEANPKANAAELMKMLADAWKLTPAEERVKYNQMAELEKDAKKKLKEQVLTS